MFASNINIKIHTLWIFLLILGSLKKNRYINLNITLMAKSANIKSADLAKNF